MNISDLIGEKIIGTDYTGEHGEFRISLDIGSNTLYVSACGHGEIDLRAKLNHDETPLDCIGKRISAIDYEQGLDTRFLAIEFEDGSKLEFEAGGREEVSISVDLR